jgi:hypothetical protein
MKSVIYKLILLISICQVASCGYFNDAPQDTEIYDAESMRSKCNLDANELHNIFTEDVSNQIDCLENNFNHFIKYVKRENPHAVSEQELEGFVRKFFTLDSESFIKGLRFLFELNMILLNDQRNSISTENIKPLFLIMQKTNIHAVNIFKLLKKVDSSNYLTYRDEIISEFSELMNSLLSIISGKNKKIVKINIMNFISNIKEKFPSYNIDLEKAESLLFIKKLILGGSKTELNSNEVKQLLSKAPKGFQIGLDLVFLNEQTFKEKKELYQHYRKSIQDFRGLLYPLNDRATLFETEIFVNTLKSILGDTINLDKVLAVFKSFQKNLLGQQSDFFRYKDLKTGLHYLEIATVGAPYHKEFMKKIEGIKEKEYFYKKSIIKEIKVDTNELSSELKKLIGSNIEFPEEQNLLNFFADLNEHYVIDSRLTNDVISSLFSLKTLFVGGAKENFLKKDIISLLQKAPDFVETILKVLYVDKKDLYNDSLKFQFFLEISNKLASLFHVTDKVSGEDELIIKREELLHIADYISRDDSDFNIHNYMTSIDSMKSKIIGGDKDNYMLSEFHVFIDLVVKGLENSLYFNETYKVNDRIFKRNTEITFIAKRNLPIYKKIHQDQLDPLYKSFLHQAKTYRYYRRDNGVAYYNTIIKRTREGFVESSMINYIFRILQKSYGSVDEQNVVKFSRENLKTLLLDFKPVLQNFDMWTINFENFVRNILLLSDLFQNTSNSTGFLEIDETTEFGVLVLQTVKLSTEVFTELQAVQVSGKPVLDGIECSVEDEGKPTYPVPCHREYFFDIFFNKLNHKIDFPKFYKFYQDTSKEDLNTFLLHIEGFSREYMDPTMPIAQRDYGMIIGALLNIESTFIRFDKDEDNILNREELDEAFKLYRSAIISLAGLSESREKYAKSIFLYLVKNKQIPSKVQLLNFHYNPFVDKDIIATRLHLGAVLYYLVRK